MSPHRQFVRVVTIATRVEITGPDILIMPAHHTTKVLYIYFDVDLGLPHSVPVHFPSIHFPNLDAHCPTDDEIERVA